MIPELVIGLVGPCGAGKSTIKVLLQARGFPNVRHIAQEHSYVPYMWERMVHPDLLIFLDVSFETSTRRRNLVWVLSEYEEQQRRLSHARQHAHLIVNTDPLSTQEVLEVVFSFIIQQPGKPAS